MELQAVTGQLHIIDGVVQNPTSVPGLLAQAAPAKAARGRENDFLFVHLTLTGQLEETAVLVQDLLDAFSARFYQATGSVTAALRRAMAEMNDLLLRLNLSGTSTPREGAVTCAVLHRGQLFMLQTGETLAVLGHNFGVERLPKEPPDRITPLGRSAGIDVRYFHHQLHSGNMLLLADPRIAHLSTQALAPALVDSDVEYGLEELRAGIGAESARLLLIEFTEDAPIDVPEIDRTARDSKEVMATIPEPSPPVGAPRNVPAAESGGTAPRRTFRTMPAGQPIRKFSQPTLPDIDVEHTARRATSEAAMGLSRFTGWVAVLLGRLRPSRRQSAPEGGWAMPTVLAIVIPLILAAIVTSVYLQRGQVRRFADIKVAIGQNLDAALSAGDNVDLSRAHYAAVLELASEAESLRPADPEIAMLRQQALLALDKLDDVTRLATELVFAFDEEVSLSAITLREGFNGGIYVLDGANSVIYQLETDESYSSAIAGEGNPAAVLYEGRAVGNQIVGQIVDIYWRSKGSAVSREGLAVLDQRGTFFTYYANFDDTRAVPLGLASEWRLPQAVTTFDERLYVLDPAVKKIWKYFPDGEGFVIKDGEETLNFTDNPDLASAVDIAIYSEDGSLLVVYSDGRIRYYDTRSGRIQWDEQTLMQNGLGTPLMAPSDVKLVGRGLNASIFVADPGSSRIIQLSRGGTILAQYRGTNLDGSELFANMSDFAVAETPLRIFAAVGNQIYVASP